MRVLSAGDLKCIRCTITLKTNISYQVIFSLLRFAVKGKRM